MDKIKSINTQSERIDSENQDLDGDQMTVDFLLSIYSNLDTHTNFEESEKDKIIKKKIQEIIIESWVASQS